MKKFIAFVLILLVSVSSLQLCSATEPDGGNSNNLNTNNGYPIIIQMPANTQKDSKDSKFEKFKDIVDITKWPAILLGIVFLYIKYHKPVEDFSDKMSEHVEKITDVVSYWSGSAISATICTAIVLSIGYCLHGGAALLKTYNDIK